MTACKELKERILNSEEYLDNKKKKNDEFNEREKIDNMEKEILSWFKDLPLGTYKIYGEKFVKDIGWFKKVKKQKEWQVLVTQGINVFFNTFTRPTNEEIEWIYNNKEQVCKEIKFVY